MLYRRALTREMGLTTGAVLTVLVAIALVVLFIRLLGDVARGELANEAVFVFLGFSLLYFLPVLMTIALFAGVLLPLSRMWRDSEMVIWFNAGLSLTQWMRPVLIFAVPFSLTSSVNKVMGASPPGPSGSTVAVKSVLVMPSFVAVACE